MQMALVDLTTEPTPMAPFREPVDPENPDDYCEVCTSLVRTMTFRGTGACSQLHLRVIKGQLSIEQVDEILSGARREDGIK